jgi:phosphate starvation-inducible PhoH-like protein
MSRRRKDDKEFTNNQYSPFTAKNGKQKELFYYLDSSDITIAHGAAGTGKTACAVSKACEHLHTNKVDKIIISRPAVEAGESLGFIPGELADKIAPFIAPVRITMNKVLGKSHVDYLIKTGKIEALPLAYCRGHTFEDSYVILDEAQNTRPEQMKMFLTRIGQNSKMVITGDSSQTDIRGTNGLEDAIHRVSWMPSVEIIKFSKEDIVRNSIISDILSSYDD